MMKKNAHLYEAGPPAKLPKQAGPPAVREAPEAAAGGASPLRAHHHHVREDALSHGAVHMIQLPLHHKLQQKHQESHDSTSTQILWSTGGERAGLNTIFATGTLCRGRHETTKARSFVPRAVR